MANKEELLSNMVVVPGRRGYEMATKMHNYAKAVHGDYAHFFKPADIGITDFPNNEIDVEIKTNLRKRDVYTVQMVGRFPNNDFVELCLINDTIKRASASNNTNVIGSFYQRQDRKDRARTPISARAIADSLEGKGADHFIVMDPHTDQYQGFFTKSCDTLTPDPLYKAWLKQSGVLDDGDYVVVSPDVGGGKRAERFAHKLGIADISIIYKLRKGTGEVKSMKLAGDVKDKNVLIRDDMVDGGSTLATAANLLRDNGAKDIYAFCTHGILSGEAGNILREAEIKLITTDIFCHSDEFLKSNSDWLSVVSAAPLFLEAVYRTQTRGSISETFRDDFEIPLYEEVVKS